jgi:hypothetical protein
LEDRSGGTLTTSSPAQAITTRRRRMVEGSREVFPLGKSTNMTPSRKYLGDQPH